jgi:hypothetical protein
MAIPSRALVPAHPLWGDIVIHQLPRRHGLHAYLLSKIGRRSQTVWSTYVDALAHAERQALRASADVWYTSDDDEFSRVAHHRRPA